MRIGGKLPMSIIRQGSIFDIHELYELEPTHRFEAIFSAIDIYPILAVVSKKSVYGAPVELNYPAMIYSLIARITERIPMIKDLIKRLKNDFIFRLDCGFLMSDAIPSESYYSRMIAKISETNALEQVQENLIIQAISEGFVPDNTVAIDATHIEARTFAVGTQSQYILQSIFSSGSMNDGKAAIPLLKGVNERLPALSIRYGSMDAGYDYPPIYKQIHRIGAQSVIAYN
jgi:transposase